MKNLRIKNGGKTMKDILCKDSMTKEAKEQWIESIGRSPYYNIACEMLRRNKVNDPNVADLFEAFHEIAKIDNKVNRNIKEK